MILANTIKVLKLINNVVELQYLEDIKIPANRTN